MKEGTRLSEVQGMKSQNLHLIRFLASIGVILAHSFILSSGSAKEEWLMKVTQGQLGLGGLGVAVFFLCGGYLIAKSLERLKTSRAYFKARIFRILPPLIFVTVSMVILGVFFTGYTPLKYFTMVGTWKYLLNSFFVLVHDLPGVFSENIYVSTVNGSLWTLPVEFLCYIGCFILYRVKLMQKKYCLFTLPFAGAAVFCIWLIGGRIPIITSAILPCILFYMGILYWVYREYIVLNVKYALLCAIGLGIMNMFNFLNVGMILFFPYIMFTIWFGCKQCPKIIGKLGNYSFGVYLWGFPIQQAIVQCMGGKMNPYLNMIIAVPASICLGIVTYVLVEKTIAKYIM